MQILTSCAPGFLRIYFEGELDHNCARTTMDTVDRILLDALPRDCVIDMGKLNFMDSSGIAVILHVYKNQKLSGGRLWIENAAEQPMKVLDTSGIERLLNISLRKEA